MLHGPLDVRMSKYTIHISSWKYNAECTFVWLSLHSESRDEGRYKSK
jgi:hypothetical protein